MNLICLLMMVDDCRLDGNCIIYVVMIMKFIIKKKDDESKKNKWLNAFKKE